jgi:N-dimethylarginine dimethylaminohydrolase
MTVSTFTDWETLREIVVGSPLGANMPALDISGRHFSGRSGDEPPELIPTGVLQRVVEETAEDLEDLCVALEAEDVVVRRPAEVLHTAPIGVGGWWTTGTHALMPRDSLLVVGDLLVEAPMPVRSRYAEIAALRPLIREYAVTGARWVAAPRPFLPDETYRYTDNGEPVLAELEPLFDAANVLRCGRDVFFNISNTGNHLGSAWLAHTLGDGYRLHEMSLCDDHVGTTVHLLRPGLLLANASRLTPDTMPEELKGWDVLWVEDIADDGYAFGWPRASRWIGMNILSLDANTVIVPEGQRGLVELLERKGLCVIPVRFRHGRTWGGGFHCCTVDVRRDGKLESYL